MEVRFDLGKAGQEYAAKMFASTRLADYCVPAADFEKCSAATYFWEEDVPKGPLPSLSRNYWEGMSGDDFVQIRKGHPELDEEPDAILAEVLRRVRPMKNVIFLFGDPMEVGMTFKLADGSLARPLADGATYMLTGAQIQYNDVYILRDHCCNLWGGGVLVGTYDKAQMFKFLHAKIVVRPCSFICGLFDGASTMICDFA